MTKNHTFPNSKCIPDASGISPTFISMNKLSKRLDRAESTLYRWSAEGLFPASVKVGPHASAWRVAEVEEWERDPPSWRKSHAVVALT